MRDIRPKPPQSLNLYARELLEALAGHPEAAQIVLGGGVALSHYLEYRGTVDVDAWWRTGANRDTRDLARRLMEELAAKHGLQFRLRSWGDTESYELRFHVERLELQRPLEKISSADERASAGALRQWFKTYFCTAGAS